MTNPKFSVGDEVVVYQMPNKGFNGATGRIVDRRNFPSTMNLDTGEVSRNLWVYWLDTNPGNFQKHNVAWNEKSLRPKPKGAGQGLSSFMEKIRNQKTETREPVKA